MVQLLAPLVAAAVLVGDELQVLHQTVELLVLHLQDAVHRGLLVDQLTVLLHLVQVLLVDQVRLVVGLIDLLAALQLVLLLALLLALADQLPLLVLTLLLLLLLQLGGPWLVLEQERLLLAVLLLNQVDLLLGGLLGLLAQTLLLGGDALTSDWHLDVGLGVLGLRLQRQVQALVSLALELLGNGAVLVQAVEACGERGAG